MLFWNFDILSSLVLPEIITFLKSIWSSGCEDLTCMGFYDHVGSLSVTGLTQIQRSVDVNQLKAFEASSQVLFSPQLLPFTIQTIRFSSLEKLRLSSIKLSSAHWDKLLRHLAIPTLVELQVDADCMPSMLICFLARHPAIDHLAVNPRPGARWRMNRVMMSLTLFMAVLDGPLSHVLPVLWCHHIPPTLTCLGISLQDDDASPDYITTILRCVDYCDSVGCLLLSISPQSHSCLAMSCIPGIHSAVLVKRLAINYSDAPVLCPASAGDALALSAAWIEAFPEVKYVSMWGYSTITTGDLVRIICRFAVDDVILSVELQSHLGM
ncbi:hypothetical protein AZE42_12877 [Rhizopogon vesiculosus]|uniref:F-box domain-containing protein n=1 Tax=Rhizopogon vesiculosus TaxID=180088 RepID=A0A1J8PR50_9AGAM|nr:hypothetical protein AZE42_12877 [Rhizopogon vesiculosus]